ncbi:MAG: pyridoxal phosphate-dependent aminotransferase family protein [Aquaticitalea sp.]
MYKLPEKLKSKLEERKNQNTLRKLGVHNNIIDFASNDYLGFSKSKNIFTVAHRHLIDHNHIQNGSTGSRLLSGNHILYDEVEDLICKIHDCETTLIFNSGYDANLGFFSCVPQRGDFIFYDELIHASIRDGIRMGNAKAYKFKHNDLEDLKKRCRIEKGRNPLNSEFYIVTESVFSMDGDSPDLKALASFCKEANCHLIVDEAHAVGVFGVKGVGIIQQLELQHEVFARLVTFGKALGCHGAAILGSAELKKYLVNFSRPLIYTTALPPHSLATIQSSYAELNKTPSIELLHQNILTFKAESIRHRLQGHFIESDSSIQCCIISGNEKVKSISKQLQNKGFDVKPILSPTIPQGKERLRFSLHAYNSRNEISEVLSLLSTFVT